MMASSGSKVRVIEADSSEMMELAQAAVAAGASIWIRARGMSMAPVIPSGTPVRVSPLRRRPEPGDILLVRGVAGRPLIHRVTRVMSGPRGDRIVLRGDSHLADDPPIEAAEAIGRVDRMLVGGRELAPAARWPHRLVADLRRTGRRVLARARGAWAR